jgi:hypothetical protein
MKIIEKINENYYIGQKETGVYAGTRYIIKTNASLNEGDIIEKENPIEAEIMTLCQLCIKVYNGGENYSEAMKQQAVDFFAGYINENELEYGL